MRVEIFDVGHGQCAVITGPNGQRMMIDCGDRWGDETFWTPSLHYLGQTIDLLALTNLDEDLRVAQSSSWSLGGLLGDQKHLPFSTATVKP